MAKIKLPTLRKKPILLFTAGLAILFGAIIMWSIVSDDNTSKVEDAPATATITDASAAATEFIANGDTEKAMSYYDEQIKSRQDEGEKQLLLVMKSRSAQRAEQYDLGVEAAKQAYDMDANEMTARALAEAYVAIGDKQQAIVYYKRLLEMESQHSNSENTMDFGPTTETLIWELEQ